MIRAIDLIVSGAPWSITQEMMETIYAIADRKGEDLEALAARLDRPLENAYKATERDGIAIIPMNGPIFPKANLMTQMSGAHSLELVARDFNLALENDSIHSVLLHFEAAPGGVAGGIHEFSRMIRDAGKPIHAYVGAIAASAHYWIASAADSITVDATAMVGNIGVITSRMRTKECDKIIIVSSHAQDKRPNASTEDGAAIIQSEVDALEDVFLSSVAEFRNTTVNDLASHRGRMLIGASAVKNGFADALGSLESVIAGLSGATTSKEGFTMADKKPEAPDINRAYLAEHHPDIVASLIDEGMAYGVKAGTEQGATAERERIQAVQGNSLPGHEKLIAGMAFDGKTTGPEAAVAVLSAEKQARSNHAAQMKSETPSPVAAAPEQNTDIVDKNLPVNDRCKAEWEKSPELRSEFMDLESYVAYTQANEAGRVRKIGGKS